MAAEFHIVVYNESEAEDHQAWGGIGYTFAGMTGPMRTTLIKYLRATLERLEKHAEQHPEEGDEHGADETWDRRGVAGDRGRQEDGRGEFHGDRQDGAPGGELRSGSLILPPGVRR